MPHKCARKTKGNPKSKCLSADFGTVNVPECAVRGEARFFNSG